MSTTRFTRRKFLKLAGASGMLPVLSCAREPVRKLVPYVTAEEEIVPGIPVWYATVCRECPAGCGMLVKTREGRAIKAEGNPSHPVNRGKLCPRGQASLQGLYNPGRITGPMMKDSSGKFRAITWEEGLKVFAQRIAASRGKGRAAFVTPLLTGALDSLISRWTTAMKVRRLVYEPYGHAQLREANRLCFGRKALPVYSLEKAKFIINFGADFLETWISPVFYAGQFREARKSGGKSMPRAVHVGPRLSLTGANSDEWISLVPGTDGIFILGMAHVILREKLEDPGLEKRLKDRIRAITESYTPEFAASKTGTAPEDVVRLAREFARVKPSLALGGGSSLAHRGGTATMVLVNVLNVLAGNIGKTVLFGEEEALGGAHTYGDMLSLAEDMRSRKVPLLLLYDVDPLMTMPASAKFNDSLRRVDFIVSFSSIHDETTDLAHLLLPDNYFLESWGSYSPRTGVHGLMQPVMAPVHQTRALGDVLLSAGKFPWKTFEEYLKDEWKKLWPGAYAKGKFEDFWRSSLGQGGAWKAVKAAAPGFQAGALKDIPPHPAFDKYEKDSFHFLPYPSHRFYDGRNSGRPWLQELPDPMTGIVWDTFLEIHPERAEALGISTGDVVRVTSPNGSLDCPAFLSRTIRQDTVAMPMGHGTGVNPLSLLSFRPGAYSGCLPYFSTMVGVVRTGKRVPLAITQGSESQDRRGIAQVVPLSGISETGGGRKSEEGDLYGPHPHPEHRWGMTIDLSACIGCGACVVACYAENNVPVVGKELCLMGREMSWIRIERFKIPAVKKEGNNKGDFPGYIFIPMLCQQCDKAPCESVCPVFATYHNPEGLNAQIYNRCVGTRYCSHNCPYKVRRFNWFDYKRETSFNLQLNPDVTIREKGVMEKCSFCIQRIRAGKDRAKDEARGVRDGEIVPACAQTCPTNAIVFGDLKDPRSAVSILSGNARGYHVFGQLNTVPSITYLKKVVHG